MIRLMQGKSLYLAVANTLRTTLSFYRLPAVAGQQEVGLVVGDVTKLQKEAE